MSWDSSSLSRARNNSMMLPSNALDSNNATRRFLHSHRHNEFKL